MFNYEYPPLGGGGGVVHQLIAEELAKRHRCLVITSGGMDLPRTEQIGGVEIRRVPVLGRKRRSVASLSSMLSYPALAWFEARRVLRTEKFDVINAHFAVPTGPGSLLAAKLGSIPHVLTVHGGDLFDPTRRIAPHRIAMLRATVRWVLRGSQIVVAQSSDTAANARNIYGFDGDLRVVPLGIRRPDFPPLDREALGLPAGAVVGVTIGRLVVRKGVDRLLRILEREGLEDLHLVVVGSGPQEDVLASLAAEIGVSDRVTFTGWVSEERKWQLIQASDLYLSASHHEGFGLVFLEGMACGLPVVCPDRGGQTDFLRDGETGYLVAAGDDDALAAAILRLAASTETRKRMGQTNRLRFEEFTIERCAQRYEQIFEESVHRDRGAQQA